MIDVSTSLYAPCFKLDFNSKSGKSSSVINPESLVKSLVFDGSDADVIKPLSLVKSLVFDGSDADVIKPLSLVKSLVFDGISVLLGKAPTSLAVYVGFVACFAQDGTVGSVSVYDVKYVFESKLPSALRN